MYAQIRDPVTNQEGLLFQIDYPEIAPNVVPRYRFMSAYEQKVEAPNRVHAVIERVSVGPYGEATNDRIMFMASRPAELPIPAVRGGALRDGGVQAASPRDRRRAWPAPRLLGPVRAVALGEVVA